MSARDPDDLLRDGGGEIGDLYRRLPRYEPPRRLDRAVLNEAARAVLADCFPGRDLLQVDALDIVQGGGGIHCITQQEPA